MPKLSSIYTLKSLKLPPLTHVQKICWWFFFISYMHLKTLTEVGAPGDIGQNAAPPVAIWALENVIDYVITPSHRMAGKFVRVRSLTSNFATSHLVLKVRVHFRRFELYVLFFGSFFHNTWNQRPFHATFE